MWILFGANDQLFALIGLVKVRYCPHLIVGLPHGILLLGLYQYCLTLNIHRLIEVLLAAHNFNLD